MSEFDHNFEDGDFRETDVVWALAGDLEEVVCRYDRPYADGESGLFELAKKTGDKEGSSEKKVTVRANRIYTEGKLYLTNYEVSVSTKYFNLSMHSFPEDIWEVISHDVMNDESDVDDEEPNYVIDEDWLNELGDEETEFAIEFIYSHIITSDGAVYTNHEMIAHVNEKSVPLPENRAVSAQITNDMETVNANAEVLGEFMQMFDPSDLALFREIGRDAVREFELTDTVVSLYTEMRQAQLMSTTEQMNKMRELAARIFPELLQEDS